MPDSRYSWLRLAASLALATLACVGSWSVVVALPAVQAEFGTIRASASLPYTCMMIGFACAALVMGKMTDRYGIIVPILIGAVSQGTGYVLAGFAPSIWVFALAHVLVGIGASIGFVPMIADISHWFVKRRALAVTVVAAGNYLAGALWSPIVQKLIETQGWRATHIGIGVFVCCVMLAMMPLFRRRVAAQTYAAAEAATSARRNDLGLSTNMLLVYLGIAGLACCIAMSMPQVHIVAYCADLGYGPAQGSNMLALMLGLGIISRVSSGFLADKIGGVAVLLIGSGMQGIALFMYLWFDGLTSLYIISGIFGLFQGGIVPMYAVIAREYLPPREAGARIGFVITSTIAGMAVGGLLSGAIYDLFGSYRLAFLNGLLWNLVNILIIGMLIVKRRRMAALA